MNTESGGWHSEHVSRSRIDRRTTLLMLLLAFVAPAALSQQDYPDRLIKFIMPTPAGSTSDVPMRLGIISPMSLISRS